MSEWMMHLYSALLCIVVHPKRFTIMWGGGGVSLQPPPVCSIYLDDATAATGQRWPCAHHTPATGGEKRESFSQSSVWGCLGGHDWHGPVVGIWPGHRGYTPNWALWDSACYGRPLRLMLSYTHIITSPFYVWPEPFEDHPWKPDSVFQSL